MISELHIQNFQSHKDTTLEFDPGVNVIVGTSDSGKTSIIRALRLVMQNRPSGDAFVSKWIKKGTVSRVEMTVDGDIVARQEYPTKQYELNDLEFRAFGLSVPEEISEALNMNETNLQGQLDSPFLLSSSPGEVAAHFNKVAHLNQIDTGLQNVQRVIKTLTSDIEYNKQQKQKLTADLEQFSHLQMFEADIEVIEELQIQSKRRKTKVSDLNVLISRFKEVQEMLKEKADVLKLDSLIDSILNNTEQKRTLSVSIRRLDSLTAGIKADLQSLITYATVLNLEESLERLLQLYKVRSEQIQRGILLKKTVTTINSTFVSLSTAEAEYERLHAQFEFEMPDICPLCGK